MGRLILIKTVHRLFHCLFTVFILSIHRSNLLDIPIISHQIHFGSFILTVLGKKEPVLKTK